MATTRTATFSTADTGPLVQRLLAEEGAELAAWAADPDGSPRLALRVTFDEPLGTVTVRGADQPVEAADLVVVLAVEQEAPQVRSAHPETTPGWSLGRDSTLRQLGSGAVSTRCPFPALQQLALCWLGQDWAADGAATVQEALLAWRAADASDLPSRVQGEVSGLRAGASGDEPAVAGVLADLGMAAPYTDPVQVLDEIAVAAA